jgi:hypothetical protein
LNIELQYLEHRNFISDLAVLVRTLVGLACCRR